MGNKVCCNDAEQDGASPVILQTSPVIKEEKKQMESSFKEETPVEKPALEEKTNVAVPPASAAVTADSAAESAQSPYEFTIKLKRNAFSEPWGFGMKKTGLTKSPAEQQLLIMQTGGKCLEEWETANPTQKVKALDEMIQVNGVTGTDAIMSMLKTTLEADITLRRQNRINVKVTKKAGGNLGAKIKAGTLDVEEIVDGPISTYNKQCLRAEQIVVGDRLVAIDGKMVDAKDLFDLLAMARDGDDVTLTFARG